MREADRHFKFRKLCYGTRLISYYTNGMSSSFESLALLTAVQHALLTRVHDTRFLTSAVNQWLPATQKLDTILHQAHYSIISLESTAALQMSVLRPRPTISEMIVM